jgi:hypothetical protein
MPTTKRILGALFAAAATLVPIHAATAQGVPDVVTCSFDDTTLCEGSACRERTMGGRTIEFNLASGTTCVRLPGQSACELSYNFDVVNRTERFAILSFPREAMMFMLMDNGTMQGSDIDPGQVYTFQGRCNMQGGAK